MNDRQEETLGPRTLGDILNETFIIYGKCFPRFLVLVGVVQIPLSLLAVVLGHGLPGYLIGAAILPFAMACVCAAVAWAVGQHYVNGQIRVRTCYSKVLWRLVSLLVITGLLAVSIVIDVMLIVLVVPGLILSVFIFLYLGLTVSAVMVEGYKPKGALDRIFNLLRGSWLRVFGIGAVVLLVTLGMALALATPFALASDGAGSTVDDLLMAIGGMVVLVGVTPVMAISLTLIYYDLRVRKEQYNISALSHDMGLAGQ